MHQEALLHMEMVKGRGCFVLTHEKFACRMVDGDGDQDSYRVLNTLILNCYSETLTLSGIRSTEIR